VSALRQDEGVGGSATPAASEAAEGVLEESAAGTESAMVVSPPSPARVGMGASLPLPAETVAAAPAASVVDVVEGVAGRVEPSSPRSITAAVEKILVPSQPAAASQECDAPRA
jgi:hypothetical protein